MFVKQTYHWNKRLICTNSDSVFNYFSQHKLFNNYLDEPKIHKSKFNLNTTTTFMTKDFIWIDVIWGKDDKDVKCIPHVDVAVCREWLYSPQRFDMFVNPFCKTYVLSIRQFCAKWGWLQTGVVFDIEMEHLLRNIGVVCGIAIVCCVWTVRPKMRQTTVN